MRVRVASFNLLNLQLPNIPFYGQGGYSQSGYRRKIGWTARLLDRLSSDIVGVQEVFSEQALRECVARSRLMRQADAVVAPHADPENHLPRVGLISKLPLLGAVESITAIPDPAPIELPGAPELGIENYGFSEFSRPVLRASIRLGNDGEKHVARVYVVHFKSRRPKRIENADGLAENMDDPAIEARAHLRSLVMRAAEASGLRQLILEDLVGSTTPVIVLGDFNDHAKAMTTEMVTGRHMARRLNRRDHQLWHASALQSTRQSQRDVGYTKIYRGEPDTIDHILLSEEFLPGGKHAVAEVRAVDYFNDHLNERDPTQSDHGAVRATLELY